MSWHHDSPRLIRPATCSRRANVTFEALSRGLVTHSLAPCWRGPPRTGVVTEAGDTMTFAQPAGSEAVRSLGRTVAAPAPAPFVVKRLALITDAWKPQTNGVVNTLVRL